MDFFRKTFLLFLFAPASLLFSSNFSILIDLSTQRISVQDKNTSKVVLTKEISSGRWGYPSSTGRFKIFYKNRRHVSNLYPVREDGTRGGAVMPYTLKYTKSGEAIHAGDLPGIPDSHGCIRVSYDTSMRLFRMMDIGDEVVVIGSAPYDDKINKLRASIGKLHEKDTSNTDDYGYGYFDDSVSSGYNTVTRVEESLSYMDDL